MLTFQDLVARTAHRGLADRIALRTEIGRRVHVGGAELDELDGWLRTATPKTWVMLDEVVRSGWYGESPGPIGDATASLAIRVGLASMARDGHLREAAVVQLGAISNPIAGAFLAIRTTDWVDEVAGRAASILRQRIQTDAAIFVATVAPIVFALDRRRRATDLDSTILSRAASDQLVRDALLDSTDVVTRRRTIGARAVIDSVDTDRLIDIATHDSDPGVASTAGVAAVGRLSIDDDGAFVRLLEAPTVVRAAVLDAMPADDLSVAIASGLLFARSTIIRAAAQRTFSRAERDVVAPYREAMSAGRRVPIAITELAHLGDPLDVVAILECLDDEDIPTRRAAVAAVRWVAPARLVELLVPRLQDEAAAITRTAERQLRGHATSIDPGALRESSSSPLPHQRRAAYRLMRRRSAPDRLEVDLIALRDPDETNRRDAIADIRVWLWRDAARSPRGDLATRRRLDRELGAAADRLSSNEVELIRFHAGLRPGDLGS